METVKLENFDAMSKEQMQEIQGGGFWKKEITIKDGCGGTYTQIFNWFGLHGTKHLD